MIRKEEIYKIGIFNKPHGVEGELLFTFTDDIFDRVDCEYVICSIDGIFVPFFIQEYRFKSNNTALMKLEDIDNVEKARMFINTDVYFPVKYKNAMQDGNVPLPYYIGYGVRDVKSGFSGTIKKVDDSTVNVLLSVENTDGEQYLIPAHKNLIINIDQEKKIITFNLPEGILTMNHEKRD